MKTKKKIISRETYLKISGLLLLADQHYKQLSYIEQFLLDLLNEEKNGHVSDHIWGGEYSVDELLKRLGIEMNKDRLFDDGLTKRKKG